MANEFKVKNGIKFPDNTIQTTAATSGSSTLTLTNISSTYTVVAGDLGKILNCVDGTFTVSFTSAATLGAGFYFWVWNTGSGTITLDPFSSETIDGSNTVVLRRGEGYQLVSNGSYWETVTNKALRGYTENMPNGGAATKPLASGNQAIALGANSQATGAYSFAAIASTASGSDTVAIAGASALSNYSTAIGKNSSNASSITISGAGATALGGSRATGTDAFAAAIANNSTSYGALSANGIAIGYLSKASDTSASAFGYTALASGSYSTAIGYAPVASGTNAVAIGGWWNYGAPTASATSAIAIGDGVTADAQLAVALGNAAIANGIKGKFVYSNGRFAANGDSQTGTFVLRRSTANGTATALTTDDTVAGGDDQIILANNSACAFTGIVVARQQASAGTASAAWEIKGLIRREGSAGTTTLVNSALTVINNAPGWTLALSADTTNGGLAVTVTGAAATNIRWVATVQTSEVTY